MLKFKSHQAEVQRLLEEYFGTVEKCLRQFAVHFERFIRSGDFRDLDVGVQEVTKLEGMADQGRRHIEYLLYSKYLFPDSRGDILGLLESLDRLPNKVESVITSLALYGMRLPPEFADDFLNLARSSVETGEATLKSVRALFSDFKTAPRFAEEAQKKESQADELERLLIRRIFQSHLELDMKTWITGIVRDIGGIPDRAEDTADRICILATKRII